MMLRMGVNVASWIAVFKANQELGSVKYCSCYICNCCGTEVSTTRDYCPGCSSAMTVEVIDGHLAREKKDLTLVKKSILNSIYGTSVAARDDSSIFSDRIHADTDSVRMEDEGE